MHPTMDERSPEKRAADLAEATWLRHFRYETAARILAANVVAGATGSESQRLLSSCVALADKLIQQLKETA